MIVGGSAINRARKTTNTTRIWGVAKEHGELALHVQQLEATIVALQQQGSSPQGYHKEPKIGLPVKFDGTRSQFRGFLNQVRLVIQMHPSRYPINASQIGLIGTLLSGSALAWFASLLEKQSPLLNNYKEFISEFKAFFEDTDNIRTTINKIRRLRQGDHPPSAYAADFSLLASDISVANLELHQLVSKRTQDDPLTKESGAPQLAKTIIVHWKDCTTVIKHLDIAS
jgi:hypothetical protein